ncbi:MAG: DUF3866 family protein [Coriobacteriia bacterium]|nr:DUF3866 family protein [Coriobacteriia bacterium]
MRLVWGTISAIKDAHDGMQRLAVALDDGSVGYAICYLGLSGACGPGDRVVVNTTAMDLGLGTGGAHFVVARAGRGEGVIHDVASGGHIMKLRYSPLQVDVLAAEAQESPHHERLRTADSLGGLPVVCCGLHSQVPLVAAAVKQADPDAVVVYCMTDDAALALGLSDVIRSSISAGLIDATVTCGQAFGGTLESVNLHSGLLVGAHICGAAVLIVAIGPGVVGTATPFGHGGVSQGEAINAVAALDGVPIACLRVSFADSRQRHRGVSHHSIAALTRIALAPAKVPVPDVIAEQKAVIDAALEQAGVWVRHERVDSAAGASLPSMRGVQVSSMGRVLADDPAFFAAAFASGDVAARLARAAT